MNLFLIKNYALFLFALYFIYYTLYEIHLHILILNKIKDSINKLIYLNLK